MHDRTPSRVLDAGAVLDRGSLEWNRPSDQAVSIARASGARRNDAIELARRGRGSCPRTKTSAGSRTLESALHSGPAAPEPAATAARALAHGLETSWLRRRRHVLDRYCVSERARKSARRQRTSIEHREPGRDRCYAREALASSVVRCWFSFAARAVGAPDDHGMPYPRACRSSTARADASSCAR